MVLPTISKVDILPLFPQITEMQEPIRGGQKLVFRCRDNGREFALKVLSSDISTGIHSLEEPEVDEVFERAKREVTILESSDCENLPRLGPIQLTRFECSG